MRVVLDTNVLVSGLLSPYGPCSEILRLVLAGGVVLVWDTRVIAEYRDVLLRPKFSFDPVRIGYLLEYLSHHGIPIAGVPVSRRLPDPDDEAFLEAAIAGDAGCIVTGNSARFPAEVAYPIPVMAPAEFVSNWPRRRSAKTLAQNGVSQ